MLTYIMSNEDIYIISTYQIQKQVVTLLNIVIIFTTMRKHHFIKLLSALLLITFVNSCKTHRDCKGKRKRAKTNMGTWL